MVPPREKFGGTRTGLFAEQHMVSERKRTIILGLYLLTLSQETAKVFMVYTSLQEF